MVTRYLNPGEIHFGDDHDELVTLLGSCVAVTVWHPRRRLGGMCHYVLPRPLAGGGGPRYGEAAFAWFLARLRDHGVRPAECETRIFGGGAMFPGLAVDRLDVGAENVRLARELAAFHGLSVVEEAVGGPYYRHLVFSRADGTVRQRVGRVGERVAA